MNIQEHISLVLFYIFFLLCVEYLCVWVRVRPALMHGWIVRIFNLQNVSKQTTTIPSIYMRFMNNDVLLRANVRKLKLLSGKSFAKLNESKCSLRTTSLIHPHLNGRWLNKRCYVISLSTQLSLSPSTFFSFFSLFSHPFMVLNASIHKHINRLNVSHFSIICFVHVPTLSMHNHQIA